MIWPTLLEFQNRTDHVDNKTNILLYNFKPKWRRWWQNMSDFNIDVLIHRVVNILDGLWWLWFEIILQNNEIK